MGQTPHVFFVLLSVWKLFVTDGLKNLLSLRAAAQQSRKCRKILPAPLRGGTEFPTIYCRWNDGGGGSVAGLNPPPTQAILMALSHHKYRCPAPLGGQV